MLAIVPILLAPAEQFWLMADHRDLLSDFLRRVAAAKAVTRTLVLSNHRGLEPLCAELGLELTLCGAPEQKCASGQARAEKQAGAVKQEGGAAAEPDWSGGLVEGVREALALVRERGLEIGPGVLIPGFRNQLLTSDVLDSAVEAFASAGRQSLVSVRPVVDHPCQCRGLYHAVGDVLCLFPEQPLVPEVLARPAVAGEPRGGLSRCFALDFAQVGGLYASPGLVETDAGAQVELSPSELAGAARACAAVQGKRIAAVEHLPEEQGQCAVVLEDEDGRLRLVLPSPAGESSFGVVQGALLYASQAASHFSLPFSAPAGPWLQLELPAPSPGANPVGLYAAVLQPLMESGAYDIGLPCPLGGELWTHNEKGAAVNLRTGREIMGRQDFPGVFEADRSLAVFSPAAVHDAGAALHDLTLFELDRDGSVHIESELDVLRFRAAQTCLLQGGGLHG